MKEAFLDTAFAIALSVKTDVSHLKAVQLAAQLQKDRTRLITTRAVLLEVDNTLSKLRYRIPVADLLRSLDEDANVEVVSLSEELYARALHLYRGRPDKEWGLVDCVSFVVMQDHSVTDALTTDQHFEQAGFRALMRES